MLSFCVFLVFSIIYNKVRVGEGNGLLENVKTGNFSDFLKRKVFQKENLGVCGGVPKRILTANWRFSVVKALI